MKHFEQVIRVIKYHPDKLSLTLKKLLLKKKDFAELWLNVSVFGRLLGSKSSPCKVMRRTYDIW